MMKRSLSITCITILSFVSLIYAQEWDYSDEPKRVLQTEYYFDPLDPSRVFLSGFDNNNSGHTWLSEDRGITWDEVAFSEYPEGYRIQVLFHPTQPDTIWGYRSDQFFLSTDRGWTWENYSDEFPGVSYLRSPVVDRQHPDWIYCLSDLDLYVSQDRGLHWELKHNFFELGMLEAYSIAVDPFNDTHLLVGGYTVSGSFVFGMLAESWDSGDSWNLLGEDDVSLDLQYDPDVPEVVVGRYSGGFNDVDELRMSLDNGQTFNPLVGPWEYDARSVFTSSGELLVVAREGVWASSDHGATWSSVLANPNAWPLLHTYFGGYEVSINPGDPSLIFLGYGTFRSGDAGETWDNASPDVPADILDYQIAPYDPNIVCARSYNAIFISMNAGLNWRPFVRGGGDSDIRFHPTNPNILLWKPTPAPFLQPGGPLLLSVDSGNTWTTIREPAYMTDFGDFDFDPETPDTVYVVENQYSLWRSEDLGTSWTLALYSQYDPLSVFFNPDEPQSVYAAGGSLVWKSEDDGVSWSIWNENVTSPYNLSFQAGSSHMIYTSWDYQDILYCLDDGLSIDHAVTIPGTLAGPPQFAFAGQIVIATTQGSVYESFDEGVTWNMVGISDAPALVAGPRINTDGTVYLADENGGSWIGRDVLSVEEDKDSAPLSDEFELLSVYPNPFNPELTVTVTLPAPSEVELTIVNIAGQFVATLTHGETLAAGTHDYTFDGSPFASGIYFVRADVPGYNTQLRKVTLLK